MVDSKLLNVFKTLEKKELKEFGRFIEYKGYKNGSLVYALYKYLGKCYPDFETSKLEKSLVSKKLIGLPDKDHKRIFTLMNKLYPVLEEFIIQQELSQQERAKNFILLDALQRRQLDNFFFLKIDSLDKKWPEEKFSGIDQMFHKYRLKKIQLRHPNFNTLVSHEEELIERLDKFYFASRIYDVLCLDSNSTVYFKNDGSDAKTQMVPKLLEVIENGNFDSNPQIELLAEIFKLKNGDSTIDYYSVKESFVKHRNLFDQFEQWDVLNLLINVCRSNYQKGKKEFLLELFKLRVLSVEEGIVIENGYIDKDAFRQIVVLGCSVKEIEWTENFVDGNAKFLKEEVKEDTIKLCQAIILFNKNSFDLVLEKLQMVKFKDALYGVQARCLLLQAYYELDGYEDLFFNAIRSFKTYLKRDKNLDQTYKDWYNNFIKFLNRIQLAKGTQKAKFEQLKAEIINENALTNKNWLLEKVAKQLNN